MSLVLAISKRELMRLRGRFGHGARPVSLLAVAAVFLLAFLAFRQAPVVGQGMYRIGLSADALAVDDPRFQTLRVDANQGRALLDAQVLDAYVDGARVLTRRDRKSLYAAGALKRYLERQELSLIQERYDLATAFPLRVEVDYMPDESNGAPFLAALLAPPLPAATTPVSGLAPAQITPVVSHSAESDAAVQQQLRELEQGTSPLQVNLAKTADKQILVPSLMNPALPFGQVLLAFLYILPVSFVSVFFTSSFMDEKIQRRLSILLSAPVTPLQIILGKMLPYVTFALSAIALMALVTGRSPILSLAIFGPVVAFIFAIYLMVPLLYRTFRDTTFISMLATTLTTGYLIFPALFSGVNDLAYMSPLTLAVKMYRGESFGWREYVFAALPMALLFGLSMYVGTRVLNEEFLIGFRPLLRKLAEALWLVMDRRHPSFSIFLTSLCLIPVVFIVQLVILALSLNLPVQVALVTTLLAAAVVEEICKSAGIVILWRHGVISRPSQVLWLAVLSSLGFLAGEKALLYFSLRVVSQSALSAALFNADLLLAPMLAHILFTSVLTLLATRLRVRYGIALLAAVALHAAYNYMLAGGLG